MQMHLLFFLFPFFHTQGNVFHTGKCFPRKDSRRKRGKKFIPLFPPIYKLVSDNLEQYIYKKYSENNTLIQCNGIILPFLNCQTIANCVTLLNVLVEKVESFFQSKNLPNSFPVDVSCCGISFSVCGIRLRQFKNMMHLSLVYVYPSLFRLSLSFPVLPV